MEASRRDGRADVVPPAGPPASVGAGGPTARPADVAPAVARPGPAPLMRPRGAWTRVAAMVLAGLGFLFLCFAMAYLVNSRGWGYDFAAYYGAGLRLTTGDGLYQPTTLDGPFRPGPAGLYLYAPPLGLATVVMTVVPFSTATFLWLALHVALLVGACALMPVSREIRAVTFGVAAFSNPVLADLILGNVSTFVLFLSVVVWRWVDRPASAVALAAAISIRPPIGIVVLWWLLRRRLAPIAWTALAGASLVVLTIPFVGIESYRDYLTVLANLSRVTGVPNNVDLGSTALNLGASPEVATVALLAGYSVALGGVLLSLRRDRELSLVVTLGASMLLSPLLWDHYLVSILVPAAFLASRGRTWGLLLPLLGWLPQPALPLVAVAATLLPLLAPSPGRPGRTRAPLSTSLEPPSRAPAIGAP